MTKDVTDKVSETTENITEKAKSTLVEGAKVIKDKVGGKSWESACSWMKNGFEKSKRYLS